MIGSLPESLVVHGIEYEIRTDYRDIINIITAFTDANLTDYAKAFVCLKCLYVDFEDMPQDAFQEAFDQAMWFIDGGKRRDDKPHPRTMDWEQDEPLIFPAINKVAGYETRQAEYIHWWTFLGYFMEISEGVYASVLTMRGKRAKGEKLEKAEQKWWAANKDICVLKAKLSDEEQEAKDRIEKLLG